MVDLIIQRMTPYIKKMKGFLWMSIMERKLHKSNLCWKIMIPQCSLVLLCYLINTGQWYLCHVPSTLYHNCKYTCQRVLCLFTWWHQQRVASHCFGKLWLWGEFTWPISSVHGSFGEHLGRPKIAHGSYNDVRRLCWPNFRDIHGLLLVLNISVHGENSRIPQKFFPNSATIPWMHFTTMNHDHGLTEFSGEWYFIAINNTPSSKRGSTNKLCFISFKGYFQVGTQGSS